MVRGTIGVASIETPWEWENRRKGGPLVAGEGTFLSGEKGRVLGRRFGLQNVWPGPVGWPASSARNLQDLEVELCLIHATGLEAISSKGANPIRGQGSSKRGSLGSVSILASITVWSAQPWKTRPDFAADAVAESVSLIT
jgi:hypothetical protein